ncbi:EamA family transporter [Streptomyces uncialis]|uniref:EamA family transporter n=1 Tax=Streptomyces uncialis TaxID=1048205 RepID=UPI0037A1732B
MFFLNRGLSRGAMSVVVPVSAVTGVALSVLCGVLLLGERPSLLGWLGIAVTAPALWLVAGVSRRSRRTETGGSGRSSADGLVASVGVAVQYIGLAQAGPASGLWPVAASRLAAVLLLLPSLWHRTGGFRQPGWVQAQALLIGAGAALGLILYLLAAQQQMLSITVVLASLYPAIPTLLGLAVLRETLTRAQGVGLVSAAVAVVFLTWG